jgi:hypothetical protein
LVPFTAVFCTTLLLAGCSGVPLDEQAPGNFDLSGEWVLDSSVSDEPSRRGTDFRSGFMTQDFPLLVSRRMRIEQDARSMGIEYERGSYRDVSWGERQRGIWEVRSGWHEGALHIYSEAPDISAAEIWRLSEDGHRLTIEVEVKGAQSQRFVRVFEKSAGI